MLRSGGKFQMFKWWQLSRLRKFMMKTAAMEMPYALKTLQPVDIEADPCCSWPRRNAPRQPGRMWGWRVGRWHH